jgi:hypothetical protein
VVVFIGAVDGLKPYAIRLFKGCMGVLITQSSPGAGGQDWQKTVLETDFRNEFFTF